MGEALPALAPDAFLDALSVEAARAALLRCCGARRWAEGMLARRPFQSRERLMAAARAAFAELEPTDLLEAFLHHPAIGEDLAELRARFGATASWSEDEQSAVGAAGAEVLGELAAKNRAYRARFGYIFIVCATGKSAGEMLAALTARLENPPDVELALAAVEQEKITLLRLEKLTR